MESSQPIFHLALDCSTARGSLALADGAMRVRWQAEIPAGRGHGGELFAALERAMGEVRAVGGKLGLVSVGLGPGSYSGVRQSIAAAVGLAEASGASMVGVPSPVVLVPTPIEFQAVGDARRGAFYYSAVRDCFCAGGPELLPDAASLERKLAEHPDWPVFVVESRLPDGLLPEAAVVMPDASRMFGISADYCGYVQPPLEPIYLRPVSITLPKKP